MGTARRRDAGLAGHLASDLLMQVGIILGAVIELEFGDAPKLLRLLHLIGANRKPRAVLVNLAEASDGAFDFDRAVFQSCAADFLHRHRDERPRVLQELGDILRRDG